jgi:phosphoglucosamine mutase
VADAERSLRSEGRIVLRYSGTEPLARVMVEGADPALVQREAERLVEVIRAELGS